MTSIRACGQTDTGLAREHNEDCFAIDAESHLYVVADGMGGHSYGEVASRISVDSICTFVSRRRDPSPEDLGPPEEILRSAGYDDQLQPHSNVLKAATLAAQEQVLGAIQEDVSLRGMGTTVVGLHVSDGIAAVANVGDSRIYRIRRGEIEQLSVDHTWVHEQVMAGFLTDGNYVMLANLGVAHSKQGNYDLAIVYLQQAVEARPDFDHGHFNLGVALERADRLNEAMEHYRLALQATPNYPNAHFALGILEHRLGNPTQAVEHYRPALEAMPANVELRILLARALHGAGALDEAMEHYREALRMNPEHAGAHENLARALAAQGRIDEASRHLAEARQLQSR